MPIRAENKARYPRDWKTVVVPRIKARSGNRCECTGQCGHQHFGIAKPNRCLLWNGDVIDDNLAVEEWRRVVLTVAHLDHTPENCADDNLLHLCQGCHNRYDAPHRRAGIKERARAPRAVGDLFACEETQ